MEGLVKIRHLRAVMIVLSLCLLPAIACASAGFPNQTTLWSSDESLAFGQHVALGTDTLAVTDLTTCTSSPSGSCLSVFVFQKLLGAWTEVALLTVNDTSASYISGVSISSDESVIALGLPYSGAAADGAVYVFQKPAAGWHDMTQSATLTIPGNVGSNLGNSLTMDGDTVLASFYTYCGGTYYPACERIAVYPEPVGGWTDSSTPTAVLSYSGEGNSIYIGNQITASDGYLVTNLGNYPSAPAALDLLVFAQPAGGWISSKETAAITPPAGYTANNSGFGSQLALAGTTLAVSASDSNYNVLVYQEPAAGWQNMSPTAVLTPPAIPLAVMNLFTASPAWIVAGGTNSTASSLYLFNKPSSGWANSGTPDQTLSIPVNPAYGSANGAVSVALADNAVAIGSAGQACPSGLNGSPNECSVVYLYDSAPIAAAAAPELKLAVQGGFAVTGSPVTLNMTLANSGAAAADNLQVTGTIPAQLVNAQVNPSQGSCQITGSDLTCTLGSLAAGETATVSLTATAPSTPQFLTQSATWSTSSPVRSLRHDQAGVTYWVDSPPVAGNVSYTAYCCVGIQGNFAGQSATGATLTYKVDTPPAHGQVSMTNVPVGQFVYMPDAGFVGTDTFTYVVNDGYMDSKPGTVTMTYQQPPPPPPPPSNPNPLSKAVPHAGAFGIFDGLFLTMLLMGVGCWRHQQHRLNT